MRLGATALCLLAGCATTGLSGGVFTKPDVQYRIGAPEEKSWRPVAFADNDLAWARNGSGQLIAANATCQGHEDPPLDVLTTHLLLGFTERQKLSEKLERLDGREALRTVWRARLDGVPVELELVVLKKNGCVHDFTLIAPPDQRMVAKSAFEKVLASFAQEKRP